MEFSQPTFSPSSLLCQESQTSLEDSEENDTILEENDEEFVQILLHREINRHGVQNQEFSITSIDDWIKAARLDAINHIFRTRLIFEFKIQTGYLAVTYMDRFLSKKFIKDEKYWVLPLLAISCLSLAAKMEECKVPELSQLGEKNYKFENRVIQRMELLVLDTLEWKLKAITPFDFINYFVSKFCQNNSTSASKVVEVILRGIKDEITIQDRPSVIAAAATLFAFDPALTKESLVQKINALPCTNSLNIEEVFCLYNRLKQQEARNSKFQNNSNSPPLSPSFQLRYGEDSSKSVVGSKRKSINFGGESSTNIDTGESVDTEHIDTSGNQMIPNRFPS